MEQIWSVKCLRDKSDLQHNYEGKTQSTLTDLYYSIFEVFGIMSFEFFLGRFYFLYLHFSIAIWTYA